jgi:hypothetical protein
MSQSKKNSSGPEHISRYIVMKVSRKTGRLAANDFYKGTEMQQGL